MYRLRIDIVNDLNSEQLLESCGKPDTHVIVRHELPHGNPHYHAYIKFNNDTKENTLRQRIKRKIPYLKPAEFSIKKCDELRINEYVQYMFNTKHGNKWELISTNNFDDKLLNDLIQNAKEISDDFTERHKKNNTITIWDIAEEVEIEARKILINKQLNFGRGMSEEFPKESADEQYNITIYTDIAIQIMRKHRKAFDEFLLRKVISTAMSSNADGKEILRRKMIKNFAQLI